MDWYDVLIKLYSVKGHNRSYLSLDINDREFKVVRFSKNNFYLYISIMADRNRFYWHEAACGLNLKSVIKGIELLKNAPIRSKTEFNAYIDKTIEEFSGNLGSLRL